MGFDVTVLPPFTPGMVIVLRGVDVGDEDDATQAIFDHYRAAAEAMNIPSDTPAFGMLPLIIRLADPESSIETVSEEDMADAGWVRWSEPDDLLARATTALEQEVDAEAPDLATYAGCERLAEAALRGAGVISPGTPLYPSYSSRP